jgi:hypothetical protein
MAQDNASSLYALVISNTYPDLLILSNYSKLFSDYNKSINSYEEISDEIKTNAGIDIIDEVNKFTEFNLFKFESLINKINGYIYLLYYLNATTPQIKLPKFIYHALGSTKPLIVFDGPDVVNIINPNSNSSAGSIDTDTQFFDNNKGRINRSIGLFTNIINNIGFINKETFDRDFIMSKNKKLPPSLRVVLNDFYRFNIIETIKSNNTIIDPNLVSIDFNDKIKNIQLLYLKAKIIEELIQLYLKNKINEYGREIYNKLISSVAPKILDTQMLFEKLDFSIDLNKLPSKEFIDDIDISTIKEIKLFYSFVEPKEIKEQFYIYPDNYFGTNLLKNKYTININLDIIKLMLENNANILIHNNEKISSLVMIIKNNFHEAFRIIRHHFDMSMYEKNNFYSPQYYLMENYKNHLGSYGEQIYENQYNEMVTIIQSNENYNNNILKYMDVSFKVVKYIIEQYLTENMIRFSDEFDSNNLKFILNLFRFNDTNISDIGKCQYNENLGSNIVIPTTDEFITIENISNELLQKIYRLAEINNKYINEKAQLIALGLNTTNIDKKIQDNLTNAVSYRDQKQKLDTMRRSNRIRILNLIKHQSILVLLLLLFLYF